MNSKIINELQEENNKLKKQNELYSNAYYNILKKDINISNWFTCENENNGITSLQFQNSYLEMESINIETIKTSNKVIEEYNKKIESLETIEVKKLLIENEELSRNLYKAQVYITDLSDEITILNNLISPLTRELVRIKKEYDIVQIKKEYKYKYKYVSETEENNKDKELKRKIKEQKKIELKVRNIKIEEVKKEKEENIKLYFNKYYDYHKKMSKIVDKDWIKLNDELKKENEGLERSNHFLMESLDIKRDENTILKQTNTKLEQTNAKYLEITEENKLLVEKVDELTNKVNELTNKVNEFTNLNDELSKKLNNVLYPFGNDENHSQNVYINTLSNTFDAITNLSNNNLNDAKNNIDNLYGISSTLYTIYNNLRDEETEKQLKERIKQENETTIKQEEIITTTIKQEEITTTTTTKQEEIITKQEEIRKFKESVNDTIIKKYEITKTDSTFNNGIKLILENQNVGVSITINKQGYKIINKIIINDEVKNNINHLLPKNEENDGSINSLIINRNNVQLSLSIKVIGITKENYIIIFMHKDRNKKSNIYRLISNNVNFD